MQSECLLYRRGISSPKRRRATTGQWLHFGAEGSTYLRDSTSLPSSSVGALSWGPNRQAILSQELHIERLTAVPNLGLAIVLASRDASPLARHFVSAGM